MICQTCKRLGEECGKCKNMRRIEELRLKYKDTVKKEEDGWEPVVRYGK